MKNPYEIRLDILKLTQEMLEKNYAAEEFKFGKEIQVMLTADGKYKPEDIKTYIQSSAPKRYTTEEVLEKSETLYNFVSRNK
jgi:hypothetical protein